MAPSVTIKKSGLFRGNLKLFLNPSWNIPQFQGISSAYSTSITLHWYMNMQNFKIAGLQTQSEKSVNMLTTTQWAKCHQRYIATCHEFLSSEPLPRKTIQWHLSGASHRPVQLKTIPAVVKWNGLDEPFVRELATSSKGPSLWILSPYSLSMSGTCRRNWTNLLSDRRAYVHLGQESLISEDIY